MKSADKIELRVEGMTCSNCALGITRFLEKKGLKNVHVDFSTDEVSFVLENGESPEAITDGIQNLGYKVVQSQTAEKKSLLSRFSLNEIEGKFLFSLIFTFPLFLHMFIPWHVLHNPLVQLLLCIPVYAIGGWHFGKSALASLRTGLANMDVLIFTGTTAAFIYSLSGTIMYWGTPEVHQYLFYETAAMIITLVLLGYLMEQKAVQKTTTAIAELGRLQPETANLVVDGNTQKTQKVSIKDLEPGQILMVRTGEKIPVDGIITEGTGNIDESMITGESVPVVKEKKMQVIGSTICTDGHFYMRITAVGEDTVLSNIIQMVKNARMEKPAVQRLADRISAIFVPVVMSIAILTFLVWLLIFDAELSRALMISIAVLVIACPCALGLATPTAVMVGVGRAAKNGVLIKGGETLEVFSKIKYVVFDKTGTLTTGKFTVTDLHANQFEEEKLKQYLKSIEKYSSHPIAKSIQSHLEDIAEIELSDVKEVKGLGLTAKTPDGKQLIAGSLKMMQQKGIDVPEGYNVYVSLNNIAIGWVLLQDSIKTEAKETISFLQSKGITPVLLSGDIEAKCRIVAEELGITEWYAEKLPEEKLEMIRAFSAKGKTAMVGDGVNDAPALAIADIGVSMSDATDVAIHSSEVVLMKGDLKHLEYAYKINAHTLLTIKQNLFWAFFYNTLAIPVAAAGFLSPVIAAFAMAFSDVIVVGNSIRLRTKRIGVGK